jgi:hypothetical protein
MPAALAIIGLGTSKQPAANPNILRRADFG